MTVFLVLALYVRMFVLALMWWAVKVYMGCCGDVVFIQVGL